MRRAASTNSNYLSWRELKLIDLQVKYRNSMTKKCLVKRLLIPAFTHSWLEARQFVGHRLELTPCRRPRTVAVI